MKKFVKNYIKKILNKVDIIENINFDFTKKQKKILISYFTNSFKNDFEKDIKTTNVLEVNQIIKTFIDLDYCIDIVFCLDENAYKKIKNKTYDIIFGFGKVFDKMCETQPQPRKILYLTEHHPKFSRTKELERINYYYDRHRIKIPLVRSGRYYAENIFTTIDDLIFLGEAFPYISYNFNSYHLNPTGFFNKDYKYAVRDLRITKNHFLWFGSNGAIHKGLDLLIDIFKNRDDIFLHICGLNNQDRKILDIPKRMNIFDYGWVNITDKLFLELVNKCSFILLPSCSEGMSTSVLTCMRHSMIPIVMRDTGFNSLEDMVFLLEDFKISYIENFLDSVRSLDNSNIERMHLNIFEFSNKEFTIEKFTTNFKYIITNIIKG